MISIASASSKSLSSSIWIRLIDSFPNFSIMSRREPKTAWIACWAYSSPMLKNLLTMSSPGLVTTPTISNGNCLSWYRQTNVSPTPSPCATWNSRATKIAPPSMSLALAVSISPSTNFNSARSKNTSGSKAMNEDWYVVSPLIPNASVSTGWRVIAQVPVTKGSSSSVACASGESATPLTNASGNLRFPSQSRITEPPCVQMLTMSASPPIIAPAVNPKR